MTVTETPHRPLTKPEIDARIDFLSPLQILEIDLSDLEVHTEQDVATVYDRLEARIAATGEELWFFLVNYRNTRVDPQAWLAWSRRGRALNHAHSMGTARYDASPETRAQIERAAGTEAFDPNLFADRAGALARIAEMPSTRVTKIVHRPTRPRDDYFRRVAFLAGEDIAEFDFRDVIFNHSRDVHDCYDILEEVLRATGRKWYFLVNYDGCRIMSPAWVAYAARGKRLNEEFSLGSVRYAPGSETETDIRLRAAAGGFRPNIRNTRAEALERIAELKRGED